MATKEIPKWMAIEKYKKFAEDMEEAGREVYTYGGRNFYEGPAVNIDAGEYQDVARETDVRIQTDSMGKGMVIYPIA